MQNQANSISVTEMTARLRLIRTEGIGPVSFRRLLGRFGSAASAMKQLDERKYKPASQSTCEDELAALEARGGTALFWGTDAYPAQLAATEDAPPILLCLGNANILHQASVAIVGARNASANGIKLTQQIAKGLSDAGFVTVSGLARGIDTACHSHSLSAGTTACMAGGLDIIYPPENKKLYEAIIENGAVVSEMPMGAEPQARHFPRRNRIISGLARAVLIVEAAKKSGSLITARYAADQGRDVFAVPGSPLDPRAQGTNQLIKDGATLTECADDIISELQSLPLIAAPASKQGKSVQLSFSPSEVAAKSINGNGETSLLSLLGATPVQLDDLIRLSGLPADTVNATILDYELEGKITRHSGGRISRNL